MPWTGYKTPEDRARFLATGMGDVLVNPVIIKELAAILPNYSLIWASFLGYLEKMTRGIFLMLDMFTEEFPERLASLEEAVVSKDPRAVSDRAHATTSAAASKTEFARIEELYCNCQEQA